MIHGSEPSALLCETIHAGYHLLESGGYVTPSKIWNEVVKVCIKRPSHFTEMFAWDVKRKVNQSRNCIGDIAEIIRQGYVPPLELGRDENGRMIVIHGEYGVTCGDCALRVESGELAGECPFDPDPRPENMACEWFEARPR